MSTRQHSLGPINPCTCPDRVDNQLYREGYVEHPAVRLVSDPKCKRCFPKWARVIGDDPNPEYSRFDRMDGLGEPIPKNERDKTSWLEWTLVAVTIAVVFGSWLWVAL